MSQRKISGFFQKSGPAVQITSSTLKKCEVTPPPPSCSEEVRPIISYDSPNLQSTKANSSSRKRKFQQSYHTIFPWIIYDASTESAKCGICKEFPNIADQKSKLFSGLGIPFKKETFKFHESSKSHGDCALALKAKEDKCSTPFAKIIKKMDEKLFSNLEKLFNIAYHIASEEEPFTLFPALIKLLKKMEVPIFEQYGNDMACAMFIKEISEVIKASVVKEIEEAFCASLLIDESTDCTTTAQLVMVIRFVTKSGIAKETFFSTEELASGDARGVLECVDKGFQSRNICWKEQTWLVGLGTDGASCMVGRHEGVAAKFKAIHPHIISVHCVAHRLQLALLDANISVTYLKSVDSNLKIVYNFYKLSSKRQRGLAAIGNLMLEKILKLQAIHSIRWVASKVGAIKPILQDWKCIVLHLEDLSNGKTEEAAQAKGILKFLKDFRFMKTLSFLFDLLTIIKILSLMFQKKDILLSSVPHKVKKTLERLEDLKSNPGERESKFIEDVTVDGNLYGISLTNVQQGEEKFQKDRNTILQNSEFFIAKRFQSGEETGNSEAIKAVAVFDSLQWPSSKEELSRFGDKEILYLLTHFKIFFEPCNLAEVETEILMEWLDMKITGKGLKIDELLERSVSLSDRFLYLSKLLTIVASLPVSTAGCERVFSAVNRVKSSYRNRLKTETLDQLLTIKLCGPTIEEFNPRPAIEKWYFSADGQRHINGHRKPVLKINK